MAREYKGYKFVEQITNTNELLVDLGELGYASYDVSIHRQTDGGNLLYVVFMLNGIKIEYYNVDNNLDFIWHTDFMYINTKAIHDRLCGMMIQSRDWNWQPNQALGHIYKKLHDVGRGFVFAWDDIPAELEPFKPGLFFNF